MASRATLINPTTGAREAIDIGSAREKELFGQGFVLEQSPGVPVQGATSAQVDQSPQQTQVDTSQVTDQPVTEVVDETAVIDQPTGPVQIRNVDELNRLAELGLTEDDITRQGKSIFLNEGITEDVLRQRAGIDTVQTAEDVTTEQVTDDATNVSTDSPVIDGEIVTEAQAGLDRFNELAPDRAKILEETMASLGLTGAQDLFQTIGEAALDQEQALRELPDAIKERTERIGVTNRQLNRLIATEREPVAQALKDLLQSRSILGDQLAFGFQQAEFIAQGEEARFDRFQDLLSQAGLTVDPRTGDFTESLTAREARLNREERLASDERARIDNYNAALGYVENPETGQLVPTFATQKYYAENGIGSYQTNTNISSTGNTGDFGLEILETSGGTRSDRNNNPLNIKASGYTSSFAGVMGLEGSPAEDGGNFLVFDSPEAGFATAQELWRNGNAYQNVSVDTALRRWSGGGYGGEIATSVGIDPNRDAQSLTNDELHLLQQAMAKREGFTGTSIETVEEGQVLNRAQFQDLYIQQVGQELGMSPNIDDPIIKSEIDALYNEYTNSLGDAALDSLPKLTTTDQQKMFTMGLDPNNINDVDTYLRQKFSGESSSSNQSTESSSSSSSSNPFR